VSDKRLFSDDLAERLKARAGKPYRPSNGTEGEMFCSMWCANCAMVSACLVFSATLWLGTEDPNYPREWQYGEDGQPKCTAFVEMGGGA
jgi:hypothetical protein